VLGGVGLLWPRRISSPGGCWFTVAKKDQLCLIRTAVVMPNSLFGKEERTKNPSTCSSCSGSNCKDVILGQLRH
jgi:hypothetical protein